MENEREREIGERKIFKGTPGDFRAQKNIPFFPSSLLSFPIKARATLRTPPPVQTWACTSRTHVVCTCVGVCVWEGGRKGYSPIVRYMHIGFSTHLRVVYIYIMYYVLSRRGHSSRHAVRKRGKRENDREGGDGELYRTEKNFKKNLKKRKEKKEEAKQKNTGFWERI